MVSRLGCRILKYLGALGTWEEDGTGREKERKDNIPYNMVHIAGWLTS